MSPDDQLDNLHFSPFPAKATNGDQFKKITRSNSTIMAIGVGGMIYTNNKLAEGFCWVLGDYHWMDDTLVCLRKLGVIKRSQMELHQRAVERRDKHRVANRDLDSVEYAFKRQGLKLTKTQRAKLMSAAGKKEGDS